MIIVVIQVSFCCAKKASFRLQCENREISLIHGSEIGRHRRIYEAMNRC